MTIESQKNVESDRFEAAREKFAEIVERLSDVKPEMLSRTEEFIRIESLELQRRLLQAYLDVRFERERADLAINPPARGVKKKVRPRQIESQFGRVVELRHALKEAGKPSQFPQDGKLNVPRDLYSHPLRRRVAEEAAKGSFDQAVAQIQQTTAGHVPKRQAEQLVVRAAQDMEAFYAQRSYHEPGNENAERLQVLSSDGCSIRMVSGGLREATQQAADKAEGEEHRGVRGDPTGKEPVKPHQRRRVIVTAVWQQERHQRTAEDIIANLQRNPNDPERRKKARGPRPQNKRVTASIEQDQRQRITEAFDELDRQDPERQRETIALVDGDEHQTQAIKEEAHRRGRPLTLVLDLLHAMHYLWLAATAITARYGKSQPEKAAEWVTRWTSMLLTGDPARVVAAIRGAATRLNLRGKARKTVDRAADYLLKRTPHLHYADFIARGLPIASGVIEGACRHLVRDRLDITGARWNVDVAEAVLKIRSLRSSEDWDEYWQFHQLKEAQRNYAQAA